MIRARVFAIASGYEDCDDLDALRVDPAFKMACGRRPETGKDLISQPALSRLENAPFWRSLARMAFGMIDLFCASFSRVPGRIVLDIDDTDDPAHGQQELILFNTHSGGYCFQPMHIFEAGSGKFRAVAAASWKEALGRGDRASPAARHRPNPEQLAAGRDCGARR